MRLAEVLKLGLDVGPADANRIHLVPPNVPVDDFLPARVRVEEPLLAIFH